ncbi:MAG: GNAT family N-acetyltransferase [Pseudomonadota bacterium]
MRPADSADLDDLVSLNAVVQRWHANNYPKHFRADPNARALRQFFATCLQDPHAHILLALRKGQILAYLMARQYLRPNSPLTHARNRMHIEHIAVLPSAQRQGIGKALISRIEATAREQRCDEIMLDTWADNVDAQAAFGKSGFRPQRYWYSKEL